ncbi:MAG: hypothetical protein LBL04_07205 [Bacteroidales bacterium]|jgi:hypothetical protein|nr:hypothetical protein [Bacteroidales bacterium]
MVEKRRMVETWHATSLLYDRMLIVERIIHSMRTETGALENSAALMSAEYRNNKELTAFTQLDAENFY